MPTYLTGRTRPLTFSGQLAASIWVIDEGIPPEAVSSSPPPTVETPGRFQPRRTDQARSAASVLSVTVPFAGGDGIVFNLNGSWSEGNNGAPSPTDVITLTVGSIEGNYSWSSTLTTNNASATQSYLNPPVTNYNYSGSGTWSISIVVVEAVVISQDTPTGSGAETPPITHCQIIELLQPGSAWSAQATYLGLSVAVAGNVLTNTANITVAYPVTVSAFVYASMPAPGIQNVATASVSVTSPSVWGITYTDSYSNAVQSGTASATGGVVNVSTSTSSAVASEGTTTSLGATYYPPKPWSLAGVLREMKDAYDAQLQLQVSGASALLTNPFSVSSSFSNSDTQHNGSAGAAVYGWYDGSQLLWNYNGNNNPYLINEWAPVSLALTADSLLTAGEDPNDTRVLFRGWNWNALSITQLASINVDAAPNTTNWTAGSNTTLAAGLTITVNNNGPGSVSSTLANTGQAPTTLTGNGWEGVSFAGYRYLTLALTCALQEWEISQTARLTLGNKYWDLQVTGSGTIEVDLCSPTSNTSPTDNQDSKWPFTTVGPVTVTDGPMWGVSNVTSFQLSHLAPGYVYTLSGLTLTRSDHSNVTFLPGFEDWVLEVPPVTNQSGTTTTTYVRRFVDGDTDGRRSWEAADATWIHVVGGGGTTTDSYSQASLVNLVNQPPPPTPSYPSDGWQITDLMPMPNTGCPDSNGNYALYNCYLNSSLPLTYLYGGGAYYNGTQWSFGFDINVNSSTIIPAQVLFDTIDFYPGCGNVWEGTAGPYGTFPLYAAKILRAQAYGLVLNNLLPADNATVEVILTNPTTPAGQGGTTALGEYQTGLPYPHGASTDFVAVVGSNPPCPGVTEAFVTRKRQRICFSGAPCCARLFCSNDFYWPFGVQAGDGDRLPLEEWRRIPTLRNNGTQQSEPLTALTTNPTNTKGKV